MLGVLRQEVVDATENICLRPLHVLPTKVRVGLEFLFPYIPVDLVIVRDAVQLGLGFVRGVAQAVAPTGN